jgi:LemA protein
MPRRIPMTPAVLCVGALLLLIIVAVVVAIAMYNRLVTLRARVDNAWSQITVQLRRRYDLIPNLVETVKGYATHESTVFEKVTEARAAAVGAQGVAEQATAENALTETLRSLFAVAEAYPDLKANTNFLALQEELSNTESKIAYARQFYNDSVMTLNETIQRFPTNVVASMFSFKQRLYFETEEAAQQPVQVDF